MEVLVIGCSLNPRSRSQVLARLARDELRSLGAGAEVVDLRDRPPEALGLCAGEGERPIDAPLAEAIGRADAVLLAVPIYNYGVSAAAKNLIECTGGAVWEEKVVGFLCAAGGRGSYMGVMGLANSLLLDFHCLILPRFVYAVRKDFEGDALVSEPVRQRIAKLAEQTVRVARALRS